MVWTNAQLTSFFTANDQMALPNRTFQKLADEGILGPGDLIDFTADSIKEIASTLRRPNTRDPNPDPNAAQGATIPTPPFIMGAKSQLRLTVAANIIRYYDAIGRPTSAANMQWNPVLRSFKEHWEALEERKDGDSPAVPKVTRGLSIVKWSESFYDYLSRTIGARTIPLTYIIREDADVPPIGPITPGQPFSAEYTSVEEELIARATHDHPLYRNDNASVYYALEEALRSTSYASSLKAFQRPRNGRAAWFAIMKQYAGEDKWEAELKRQDNLLHTARWRGQSTFTLERFIAQHRHAFVSMSQCAEHVTYQLPNEYTRVTFLLDAIETTDAALQAAMALCRNDTGPNGRRSNFEQTAAFILPHDPVARKRTTQRHRGNAQVAETNANISATTSGTSEARPKTGIGKTGVSLRFHTPEEYRQLTREQKIELREFRDKREQQGKSRKLRPKSNNSNATSSTRQSKRLKSLVAEAVAKHMDTCGESPKENAPPNDDQLRDYLISLMKASHSQKPASTATASSTQAQPPVALRSILRRAKPAKST